MKILIPRLKWKAIIAVLTGVFIFSGNAFAKKIYPVKLSDNGIYLSGPTYNYAPGDTFVLRASDGPFLVLELTSFYGTASNTLVVINEGGQVNIGQIRMRHCRYIKVKGVGSASNNYGFYLTSSNTSQPGIAIGGRSSNVE